MRVLHMPANTASRMSYTVRALRALGVDAYGLAFATTKVQSFDGIQSIRMGNKRQPHHAIAGILGFGYHLMRYLGRGRPDIIHWYYSGSGSTMDVDIKLLRALNIPGIVEWTGVDIRIPEVEFADNPYYTATYQDERYEYRSFESLEQSRQHQKRFADIGFASTCATGMIQYIQKDIIPEHHVVQQRLILSEFEPLYPDPLKTKPLVVHSPTQPIAKGTTAVLKAVEALQSRCDFEFKLIQGMPRAEALKLTRSADIFLDQFVYGDRGLASLEAMALGKPVICYIKPSLVAAYPPELPIVNATQDNLADVLESLIRDGNRRQRLGQQGRIYVEKYHNAFKIAAELVTIYEAILARH